ncbi:hypothetical protein A9264_05705 [Vibrio sp. UCD-FRSSP16_10]|nr:hypothetical protein A9260_07945 [Vibrio sp. UCD-FRSSP16_30]OBT17136.1 hypothetical protein A9264_05705 [Vibrio sp. UCD-FRSSP16_10]
MLSGKICLTPNELIESNFTAQCASYPFIIELTIFRKPKQTNQLNSICMPLLAYTDLTHHNM